MNTPLLKHEDCVLLMPSYINGRLPVDQSRAMQEHIAHCGKCFSLQQEAQQLKDSLLDESESLDDLLRPSSRVRNLNILMARIDETEQSESSELAFQNSKTKKRGFIAELVANWQASAFAIRSLVYAQSLALISLVAVFVLAPNKIDVLDYQTFSDANINVNSNELTATHHIIRVVFHPKAAESDVRGLLLEQKAQITGGPSLSGVYTLAASGDQSRTLLLQSFRESPWIEFAEPVIYFDTAQEEN